MKLTLKIWRQASPDAQGRFETYEAPAAVAPGRFFASNRGSVGAR